VILDRISAKCERRFSVLSENCESFLNLNTEEVMTQVDGEGDRPSLHGVVRVERVLAELCDGGASEGVFTKKRKMS